MKLVTLLLFLFQCQAQYDHEDEDRGPLLQPLNYRLPRLRSPPASLLGPRSINITVASNSEVELPCRVVNLGSGSVTWLRYPELTVLSSGDTLFTSSSRVRLEHRPGSPDYNIIIRGVVASDQGRYHCQVNSVRDQVTVVTLLVSDDSAPATASVRHGGSRGDSLSSTRILTHDVVTTEPGGSVTLECVVQHQALTQPPPYFTW